MGTWLGYRAVARTVMNRNLLPFVKRFWLCLQECVGRAGELLAVSTESLVATQLEQFGGEEEGEEPPTLPWSQEAGPQDTSGALKRYYGIASILASLSVILISISVWIILQ